MSILYRYFLKIKDDNAVRYQYDNGGQLKKVIGSKDGKYTEYVKNILYNKFGQRTRLELGNSAVTTYTYNPLNRRLTDLKTIAGSKIYQNIHYDYDVVGNILGRKNSDFVTTSEVKKNSYQNYDYDDLNRLVSADGQYTKESWVPFFDDRTNSYTNAFTYDTIGNITRKNQVNKALYPDTGEIKTLLNTTYDRAYSYTGKQPHAVTRAGELSFTYDANGNMLTKNNNNYQVTLNLTWDDENRLTKTVDTSGTTEYKYDDTGKRIIKKSKYGEAVYPVPNYSVRNGNVFSKHIFVGNNRVVSKICDKDNTGLDETNSYYYLSDHLGSSSVLLDKDGKFFEKLEYFPFGETWVKEGSESKSLPFKFTGAEMDPETGLYYMGHRYYDAKLSRWCSVDPILEDYLPIGDKDNDSNLPAGGVFNPSNINLYLYCHNNPVIFYDPTGQYTLKAIGGGLYNYNAEQLKGIGRRWGRWWRVNLPLGSRIYNVYLDDNNLIDLNKSIIPMASKVFRNAAKLQWLKKIRKIAKYGKKIAPFAKKAGIVGYVLLGADFVVNNGAVISKAEVAIDAAGIFDGMEKEFIAEHADGIRSFVDELITAKEIKVTPFKENKKVNMLVEDDMKYLYRKKLEIKDKYKRWKADAQADK